MDSACPGRRDRGEQPKAADPVTVRPLVRHACGVLRELHDLREGGRITWDTWLREVGNVVHGVDAGLTIAPENASLLSATALPRVADPAQQRATENVRGFADLYVPDVPSVKGHAA